MPIYRVYITDHLDDLKVMIEQPRACLDRKFIMRAFERATHDTEIGEHAYRSITIYRDDNPILYGHVDVFPAWWANGKFIMWGMRRYTDHKAVYFRCFPNE